MFKVLQSYWYNTLQISITTVPLRMRNSPQFLRNAIMFEERRQAVKLRKDSEGVKCKVSFTGHRSRRTKTKTEEDKTCKKSVEGKSVQHLANEHNHRTLKIEDKSVQHLVNKHNHRTFKIEDIDMFED